MVQSELLIKNVEPQTLNKHALRGRFDGVTYFMTTMTLAECEGQLHIEKTEEVKTFRERVQRTLDPNRAQRIFDAYLKKAQLRFFNSLVVVLIPPKNTVGGFFEFAPFETGQGEKLSVGMLRVLSNIERTVVDGQHRFHALKLASVYTRDSSYDDATRLKELEVSVVFLTFDEVGGEGFDRSYPNIHEQVSDRARRIFVDLNQHAVKADKNTLYILDDRDFSAVAARDLIEKNPLLEMYTRWHGSGTTLGDTDHCMTTIEILNYFVEEVIGEDDEEMISTQFDLAKDEVRAAALEKYFRSPNADLDGLRPETLLLDFYRSITPFSSWINAVETILAGKPKLQPAENVLNVEQKKAIRELRRGSLLVTVAGQKAAIRAVRDAHPRLGHDQAAKNFQAALDRLNLIVAAGYYDRRCDLWLEILTRPGDPRKMKLTEIRNAAKLLAHLICGDDEQTVAAFLSTLLPDGFGTEVTIDHYRAALAALGH